MTSESRYDLTHVDALECVIANVPTALALEVAGQVVEYDVTALPLAAPRVRGVGIYDGGLVISLGVGKPPPAERRRTTAILLDFPGAMITWALEVDNVVGFVRVHREDGPESADGIGAVTTSDGRRIRWIDARRVFGPLVAATHSERPPALGANGTAHVR